MIEDMGLLAKDTSQSCIFDFPDRPGRPVPPIDPDNPPNPPTDYPYEPVLDWPPSPPVDPVPGVDPIPGSNPHPYPPLVLLLQFYNDITDLPIYYSYGMRVIIPAAGLNILVGQGFGSIEYGYPQLGVAFLKRNPSFVNPATSTFSGRMLSLEFSNLPAGDLSGQVVVFRNLQGSFVFNLAVPSMITKVRTLRYPLPYVENPAYAALSPTVQNTVRDAWLKSGNIQLQEASVSAARQFAGGVVTNTYNFTFDSTTGLLTLA